MTRTKRLAAVVFAPLAVVALATTGTVGATAAPSSHVGAAKRAPAPTRVVAVRCAFSHEGTVDPIVMPGMTGMSHLHEFFGNTGTDENSTKASLLARAGTCNDTNDHSAYWVPALYQDGSLVQPAFVSVHYYIAGNRKVTAFPAGFKAVAGRTLQSATWRCDVRGVAPTKTRSLSEVPKCAANATLVAVVNFPSCWDGVSLDSPNHLSHLSYPVKVRRAGLQCPADHPVAVPRVVLAVHYPHAARGGSGVTLSSGSPATLHADIFEAWVGNSLQSRIASAPVVRRRVA